MIEETHAGPCSSGRHKWGKGELQHSGLTAVHYEPCLKCPRVRVRVYDMKGNHIRGYFTRSPVKSKPDTRKPRYGYCYLPVGNKAEFARLDAEMRRRRINAEYATSRQGSRVYRIPTTDYSKLPTDEEGPYFGDADSGYSLSSADPTKSWFRMTGIWHPVIK